MPGTVPLLCLDPKFFVVAAPVQLQELRLPTTLYSGYLGPRFCGRSEFSENNPNSSGILGMNSLWESLECLRLPVKTSLLTSVVLMWLVSLEERGSLVFMADES